MKNFIAVILLASLVTACQSTSSERSTDVSTLCSNDNWNELGKKMALAGKSVRTFNTYKDECGDRLPATAKETYLTGFRVGLKEFCTYENGYKSAEQGKQNNKSCPLELRTAFDHGYKKGAKDLQDNKDEARRLVDQAEQRKRVAKPNLPPVKG